MSELTKDDLEFLDRIGVDDRRMKIILKNKEDAYNYLECLDSLSVEKIDEMYIKIGQHIQIIELLKKLCHDNRNINGLLDLESFHGEVQKILEGEK